MGSIPSFRHPRFPYGKVHIPDCQSWLIGGTPIFPREKCTLRSGFISFVPTLQFPLGNLYIPDPLCGTPTSDHLHIDHHHDHHHGDRYHQHQCPYQHPDYHHHQHSHHKFIIIAVITPLVYCSAPRVPYHLTQRSVAPLVSYVMGGGWAGSMLRGSAVRGVPPL